MSTPIFPWRPEYSVHIPDIDAQHQQLIGFINQLHDAMSKATAGAVLGKIMSDLVQYTKTHFAYEESMLQKRGYTALGSHRLEHQRLVQQVVDLQEKLSANKLVVTLEVMRFLKSWLANHILQCDMQYARALNQKTLASL